MQYHARMTCVRLLIAGLAGVAVIACHSSTQPASSKDGGSPKDATATGGTASGGTGGQGGAKGTGGASGTGGATAVIFDGSPGQEGGGVTREVQPEAGSDVRGDASPGIDANSVKTYFIAMDGVDSAASAGTEAEPWRTIEYALSRMEGGERLLVKGGTYSEVFDIYGPSGTEASPTVVQAYPGQTPIFSGPGINHQANSINATSYFILDGLTITNYQIGLDIGGDGAADHIVVRNLVIHDVGNHALSVHYDSSYVTLEGNTVHDTGLYTENGEGFYVGRGDSAPVDNTNHVTIRNNVLYNIKDEAVELKIGTHDCVVENNTIYSANKSGDSYGLGGGAIEVNEAVGSVQHYDANPNQLVKNNTVYDTAIAIRAGTGCLVYNNVIWGITDSGIKVTNNAKDAYTRHVYHNTVDANTDVAVAFVGGSAEIRNNIGPAATNNLAMNASYFIDATHRDYHLKAGSAPINAGAVNLGVDFDKDGVKRDTMPDVGAYEWVQ
jgi:hypothetical protein